MIYTSSVLHKTGICLTQRVGQPKPKSWLTESLPEITAKT